jgi:cell division protein FtsN
MPKDFDKRHNNIPAPQKRPAKQHVPGGVWFATGLVTGLFSAFLIHLWQSAPTTAEITQLESPLAPNAAPSPKEKMQWDFYEIFPKSSVPVVEEYGRDGEKVAIPAAPQTFVLQAGSFRSPADADNLRAELILLGMEVFIKTVDMDGQTWHRVLVGPIDTTLELNRNRNALAEASIEALTLRVSR